MKPVFCFGNVSNELRSYREFQANLEGNVLPPEPPKKIPTEPPRSESG
jgi:hypothetical protein